MFILFIDLALLKITSPSSYCQLRLVIATKVVLMI